MRALLTGCACCWRCRAGRAGRLAHAGRCRAGRAAPPVAHRAARLRLGVGAAGRRRGPGRDAAGLGHGGGGDAVRAFRAGATSNGRCCCRWPCRPTCWPTPGPTRCNTAAPLQTSLRELLQMRGALWPDVRSLGGAVLLFVLCLYPYVYLLARAALGERAVRLMEAARLLGAPMRRRVLEVALPMARPAIAAGTALALMETLADYGVGSYFGLSTFSTGIYKAWLVMNDRTAAAQLAACCWWWWRCAADGRAQRAAPHALCRQPQRRRVGRGAPAALRGARRRRWCCCARCRCCWALCCRWPGWRTCCGRRRRTRTWACRWRVLPAGPGPASSSRPARRCRHAAGAGAGLCAAPRVAAG
jgi:hypothetical protein